MLWTGAASSKGYGRIKHGGKLHSPHRIMLEAALGRRLRRNEDTCHRCDVPACVNPEHLFAGSRRDNVRDMIAKGRRPQPVLSEEGRAAIVAANKRHRRAMCPGCGRFLRAGQCRHMWCVESPVARPAQPTRAEGR